MKAIIFDFGGVFNMRADIKEFWQNNADYFGVDPRLANKITLDVWMEARVGNMDSDLFWVNAAKFVKKDTEEFRNYFFDYMGFRNDLYDFVKDELNGKYKLGMISNQIKTWLEPTLEEKGFRKIFDVIITSYEEGIVKPDINMYRKIIKDLNVYAKDCIYIDDMKKNLIPAKDLGMETILFKDTESFKKELAKLLS